MRITVIGSTGGVGRAITREVVARGHDVVATGRGSSTLVPGATPAAVDLEAPDAPDQLQRATVGADVVVMAAQPPYEDWFGRFETMLDRVVEATAAAAARLVFVDNLYAYGEVDGPIAAHTPERPANAKCALRRDLGERLLEAHRQGRVRVSIGRFSDYHGPEGDNSLLLMMGIGPVVAGRSTTQAIFDADQPHTWAYLPDVARAFATLVEDERADGRVWVLPAAEPLTQREIHTLVGELVGRPVKVRTIGRTMMRLASPFLMPARESLHVAAQFERPWVVDASDFEATFGDVEVTPHREALAATVAWARGQAEVAAAA